MKITAGNKVITVEALEAAAKANSFPDIQFLASGKVATQGGKAKFRIVLTDGSSTLKKWSETVEYTDAGGTAFGNLFDAYLLKKDDVQGQFNVKFEVNSGAGYQTVDPTSADRGQIGPLVFQVIGYDNGSDITGAVALVVMP